MVYSTFKDDARYHYPITLQGEADGVRLSCPDIAEMDLVAPTQAQALTIAREGLIAALDRYASKGAGFPGPLPSPTPPWSCNCPSLWWPS